jgi:hypothetical protein
VGVPILTFAPICERGHGWRCHAQALRYGATSPVSDLPNIPVDSAGPLSMLGAGGAVLRHLRTLLATFVALALLLAPVASARAAASMHAGAHKLAVDVTEGAMSDCMKTMQQQSKAGTDCPCCDVKSKAACPEIAGCLAKCGISSAVLSPEPASLRRVVRHERPVNLRKPPDWALRPPAPPPRA